MKLSIIDITDKFELFQTFDDTPFEFTKFKTLIYMAYGRGIINETKY